MRIGEFNFEPRDGGMRIAPVRIDERKLWAKWIYEEPPLEFKQLPREELEEMARNRYSFYPDEILPLSAVRTIIFKNKKETAMEKTMKDYVGCYLKEVEFNPPYTTIFWGDGSETRVKCVDEPYDSEKGFAMAVMKRLFGDCYFKDMKDCIEKYGGYEKDTNLIRVMCGEVFRGFGFEDSTAKSEEIQKLTKENEILKRSNELMSNNAQSLVKDINDLKAANEKLQKENEELSHSRLASENHTLTALNKDLADRNYKLEQKIEELKKELELVICMRNDLIAERDRLRQENYSKYDIDITMRAINTQVSEENAKLKKENDRLLTEVNTLDAVHYGIVKTNEELKKDLDKIRKMNRRVIFENKMLDDTNIALKSAVESLKKNNAAYNKENEDLKKAKENMAKKLAETKSLRQEIVRLKEENEELKIKLEDWINSFNYQSNAMNQLRCKYIDLEKDNAKYKDIVDMQKQYDELKEQYDLLTKCHKRQAFTISKQREEVEKLNKIKEILK